MSKKKNTLKDLDEFLKQQAATLVTPNPLSERVTPSPVTEEPPADEVVTATPEKNIPEKITAVVSLEKIIEDLETLSQKEGTTVRRKIYELILQSANATTSSLPEDKMLINTVLYLTGGSNWKDKVRDYWRNKA
jgi:hypothetical protein